MELRPATLGEFEEFSRAAMRAFHRELSDEDHRRYQRIDEPERSLAWFDDGRIVATTSAFTRALTVPAACGSWRRAVARRRPRSAATPSRRAPITSDRRAGGIRGGCVRLALRERVRLRRRFARRCGDASRGLTAHIAVKPRSESS
jgi:Acetyltransferase (GNAT) domain